MKRRPSKLADKILGLLLREELLEEIQGDMHEYHAELSSLPKWKGTLFYWFHLLNLIRPSLLKKPALFQWLSRLGLLQLNLKLAIRSLIKQKTVSVGSLISLAAGVLCFHLIYLWVDNELTTDQFHEHIDNLYVGSFQSDNTVDFQPLMLSEILNFSLDDYPEVVTSTAVHVYNEDEIKIVSNNTNFPGRGFVVDSTFLNLFNFPVIQGNKHALIDPSGILVTQKFARKLFGNENPLGRVIEIQCDQNNTYKVSGILKDIPSNSSITFDFLVPRHSAQRWRRIPQEVILTRSDADLYDLNQSITAFARENTRFKEINLAYTPIRTIYFDHQFDLNLLSKYGDRNTIKTMLFVAIVILLISAFSFTNLQTSKRLTSAKKIGIQQAVGATKSSLHIEHLIEGVILTLLAGGFTMLCLEFVFPVYSQELEIVIDRSWVKDAASILIVTFLIVLVSVFISLIQNQRIRISDAINDQKSFLNVPKVQRILTTLQYTITILLVIVTSTVFIQYDFMVKKDTGFETQNIISVDFFDLMSGDPASEMRGKSMKKHRYLVDQLNQQTDILTFSQGQPPINRIADPNSWKLLKPNQEYVTINKMNVDPSYIKTFGLEIVSGRFFSDSLDQPMSKGVVINEAAKEYWGIEDISTARLAHPMWGAEEDPFQVIGVIKDYHYEHLSKSVSPLVLLNTLNEDEDFYIQFKNGKDKEVIAGLEELYREVNPNGIFQHEVFSSQIHQQYQQEKRVGKVYMTFTLIAILLSSIGLFTYSFYEARRRTKEVGIRKVNGATGMNIFSLLCISFSKSIVIAFLLATPMAWYLNKIWLEEFANRVSVGWWLYPLAGIFVLIIALLTSSWQTIRVAKQNPVESLRYE